MAKRLTRNTVALPFAAGDPGAPLLRDLEAVLPSWPFGSAPLRLPADLASAGASD